MIIYNDKEYRNLVEQVQQNKEDIARHYEIDRALANLGIKVVGQVSTEAELPDPATYTGGYGDAYAVGDKDAVIAGTATYDYYVYTRPDPDAGELYNYWLNVGKISIQGPEGPAPILANNGEYITATNPNTGVTTNVISVADLTPGASQWYWGTRVPDGGNYQEGDMLIIREVGTNQNGNVYRYTGDAWQYVTNITGPQGNTGPVGPAPEIFNDGGAYLQARDPQTGRIYNVLPLSRIRGQRGEQGAPGKFITVVGILSDANQLPSPTTLNDLNAGYLVGTAAPYELYIQVGTNVNNAQWTNLGTFSVGTTVTVDGNIVPTFDADTKVNEWEGSESGYAVVRARIYERTTGQRTAYINITANPIQYYIAQYNNSASGTSEPSSGYMLTKTPINDYQCATKKYVDDLIAKLKADNNLT